jgi:hypothetical protein
MTSRSTPQATKNVWILFAEEKELSGAQKRRVDIVPGHKQAHRHHGALSALPPKAVIGNLARNVRFVPEADIRSAAPAIRRTDDMEYWIGDCRVSLP